MSLYSVEIKKIDLGIYMLWAFVVGLLVGALIFGLVSHV
jgi:hypothetical protein